MLKKAITIILALAMMSVTSVFASNETEESNNATQIEQNDEVTAFESDISRAVSLGIIDNKNYNFNDDITREQFCNFVYNFVNPIKELPIFKYERAPFDDTNGNDKITVFGRRISLLLRPFGFEKHVERTYQPVDALIRRGSCFKTYGERYVLCKRVEIYRQS